MKNEPSCRLLISGSTGLIGSALVKRLTAAHHQLTRLVRQGDASSPGVAFWNPAGDGLPPSALFGHDAVIHLAGEPIAAGRWTPDRMTRIRDSRVLATRRLCETLASNPPKVFLCASAIGIYGDRGSEMLDESSSPGAGFLPGVCREWEAACDPLRTAGTRVVNLRIGIVLAREGGALSKMLPIFRLGLGGRLGDGRQYFSWIAIEDVLRAIEHCLASEDLVGPVNLVAPAPVTNTDFTRVLAQVLRRPAILPTPAWALRFAMGRMADDLLLSSLRVVPRRLMESGFHFSQPELASALRSVLNR